MSRGRGGYDHYGTASVADDNPERRKKENTIPRYLIIRIGTEAANELINSYEHQ